MAAGPRTRGDATRDALIRAALEIFGRDGYEAASTRDIAGLAGVNQALIGFHFGGKKGLYMATVSYVAGAMVERIGPLLESITARLQETADRPLSAAARMKLYLPMLHRLTDALVAMYAAEESKLWARLVVREQQDPTEAFDANYDRSIGRMVWVVNALIARILNRPPEDRQVRLTVFTIVGQALIFRVGSATVLRHLGKRQLGNEDVADIQGLIRQNVTAILKAGVSA